jgi:hypothetical protein
MQFYGVLYQYTHREGKVVQRSKLVLHLSQIKGATGVDTNVSLMVG